ncbi:MAG: hypothetical protein ABIR71_08005 [Chthoniobacterales bacterium]
MSLEIAYHRLSPGLAIWQRYDHTVKADLFATKLSTEAGVYLIDPFSLPPNTMADLCADERVTGVVITNDNHHRAAADFAAQFDVPIYAHRGASGERVGPQLRELGDGTVIAPGFQAITIDGAASGEIALHVEAEGGTLILGDALINMGSFGFNFLPAKYCQDSKLMRQSLRKLLDYPCKRILFSHGTPIVSKAQSRLAALLAP